MKLISLALAAALAGTAYAQVSQCILSCSTSAATAAGCSSFADAACVCTSATFQNTAGACLIANCTAAEQQSAVQLQAALCAGRSVTGGSVTATLSAATGSTQLPSGIPTGSASVSASGSSASSAVSASASSLSSAASSLVSAASSSVAAASSSRAAGEKGAEIKMGAMVLGGVIGAVGLAVGGLAVF